MGKKLVSILQLELRFTHCQLKRCNLFPHLHTLLCIQQVQCCPPLWQLCSDFEDFNIGICHVSGWGWSSVGRASGWHVTDTGLIPQWGNGFFSHSLLSAQTLMVSVHPQCAIACINVCAHVKDPVVDATVWWITETLKTPSMHHRLGSATVTAGFPWGKQPELPMGEIPLGQYSCKK